jgi:hypothetical protein
MTHLALIIIAQLLLAQRIKTLFIKITNLLDLLGGRLSVTTDFSKIMLPMLKHYADYEFHELF